MILTAARSSLLGQSFSHASSSLALEKTKVQCNTDYLKEPKHPNPTPSRTAIRQVLRLDGGRNWLGQNGVYRNLGRNTPRPFPRRFRATERLPHLGLQALSRVGGKLARRRRACTNEWQHFFRHAHVRLQPREL